MLVNDIFLTGLGASLGGAVAGAFFGSYLQIYYSSKNDRIKEHLSDLKENVINPLIDTVSNFNFTLSDFKFTGLHYREDEELRSSDIPFEDFMANHYPTFRPRLKEIIRLSLDIANRKQHLLNELRVGLLNTFGRFRAANYQNINQGAVDTLAAAILDGYDDSFLRITNYIDTRKLYFYPVEYPMIAFSNPQSYEIFSSALTNEEDNTRSVVEFRDILIEGINEMRDRLANDLEIYNNSKGTFTNDRNTFLNRLLRVKYGTKLRFEKQKMRKKCSLV